MSTSGSSAPCILRATARHRIVVSYAVTPGRLASRLPEGLVPDTRAGQAYVCLVGVQLIKVRVLGVVGPGFRRVPAVELQVPVRRPGAGQASRGTMTVQAYVPRRLVAWAARGLYGEPVAVTSMQPVWKERAEEIEMTYRFDRAGREQRLRVVGNKPPVMPAPDAPASFLMDRRWRYASTSSDDLVRARIDRPQGPLYRVQEQHVTVRWASAYGEEWAFLNDKEPDTVLCDPGGPIKLHWRTSVGD